MALTVLSSQHLRDAPLPSGLHVSDEKSVIRFTFKFFLLQVRCFPLTFKVFFFNFVLSFQKLSMMYLSGFVFIVCLRFHSDS